MRRGLQIPILLAALALCAQQARADDKLDGTVRNATTGAAASGVDVILMQLQGGMETVGNTKTDAQGRFHFENPALGQRPMLVRAIYRGVNFHQAVPPGTSTVQVEVFDSTRDPKTVSFPSRVVVFQPNGSSLLVGEEFAVQNSAKPPAAYFRADGNFEFEVPEKAELNQVAAWGPSGMPTVQATIDRGTNRYAIAYAFRPGGNGVRVSYQLPYASNQATVRLKFPYATGHVILLAPPSVQVSGTGLQPSGTEQGMNVYAHDAVAAGTPMEINVSGTAPPPSASAPSDAGGGSAQDSGATVQVMPSRLDSLMWPVVGGFAALFALGAFFLFRRPVAVPAGGPNMEAALPASRPRRSGAPAPAAPPSTAPAMDTLDREVGTSLDALKDTLFRLELRRQAGTISEEEYSRKRAEAERILRDLVKG